MIDQRHELGQQPLATFFADALACLKGQGAHAVQFGVKVSVAVTAKEGLVVGMSAMPSNLYDGYTVDSQLEQVSVLTDSTPKIALVDRGYRGVDAACGARLLVSQTRCLPMSLKKLLKRHQVVEPVIGHMKCDGLLGRNWLKGSFGDAMYAVLCGAGHNPRLILAHLRVLYSALIALIAIAIILT